MTTAHIEEFIAEYVAKFRIPSTKGRFICNMAKLKGEKELEEEPDVEEEKGEEPVQGGGSPHKEPVRDVAAMRASLTQDMTKLAEGFNNFVSKNCEETPLHNVRENKFSDKQLDYIEKVLLYAVGKDANNASDINSVKEGLGLNGILSKKIINQINTEEPVKTEVTKVHSRFLKLSQELRKIETMPPSPASTDRTDASGDGSKSKKKEEEAPVPAPVAPPVSSVPTAPAKDTKKERLAIVEKFYTNYSGKFPDSVMLMFLGSKKGINKNDFVDAMLNEKVLENENCSCYAEGNVIQKKKLKAEFAKPEESQMIKEATEAYHKLK